jgi:WD40 repeat protein
VGVKLRLLEAGAGPAGQGEVLACAYTPDGAFVLSGGWDGHLRLWESAFGAHVSSFRASDKPVSACTVAPDGKQLVSGGLDGLLAFWDALSHQRHQVFLAHTRPISAIVYGVDGLGLGTASWDGTLTWWKSVREREGRPLTGHRDIVAGCCVTPDGRGLLSWSHDSSLRLWDLDRLQMRFDLRGHGDRVHAGAVSPDGRWAASGSRDGVLKLWDLQAGRPAASVGVFEEVCSCVFLLDGESVLAVDRLGKLTVHVVPGLGKTDELVTRLPAHCAALSPSGSQVALGCGDGRVRFVAVDGLEGTALSVTALQSTQRESKGLQRLLGRSRLIYRHRCVCPACRQSVDLPSGEVGQTRPCPNCKRTLRIASVARVGGDS